MFIAGIKRRDRVRGTGWLDCPNCHEHAAQDVVDDMAFLQAFFYRFAPVGKRRDLVCRRCGYRRPATPAEMSKLATSGEPIHRAVMAPIGLLGLAGVVAIIGLVAWVGGQSANALADQKITLIPQTGQTVPVNFNGPSAWNYSPDTDPVPLMKVSDSGGRMYFVIKRVTDGTSLEALLAAHFQDEVGLTTTGFPDKPPAPSKTTVAGQSAILAIVDYLQGAETDQQRIYVTAHNGVGYVVTYVALGSDAIKTMSVLADEVNKSIRFTAPNETPPPAPSAIPGASPTAAPPTVKP